MDTALSVQTDTQRLLTHLHRGGKYAYLWTLDEKRTYQDKRGATQRCKKTLWYNGNGAPKINQDTQHVYFGVHPVDKIPDERMKRNGEIYYPNAKYIRPHIQEIAAINTLFAEFDAKDFSDGKTGALEHIQRLPITPSVIVDSGGGYHAYWLLSDLVLLTDDNREYVRSIQARWVEFVGSDDGAKDLARVLRVPGYRNVKPSYAPNYPTVAFVKADFTLLYTFDELTNAIPDHVKEQPTYDPSTFVAKDGNYGAYVTAAYNDEVYAVQSALEGQKHRALRGAAIKLATLLWTNLLTEQEITDGLFAAVRERAQDKAQAYQTILDGIAYGKNRPREIPELIESQPLFDAQGVALCPLCNVSLIASYNGNGYRCNSGKHDDLFWWKGDSYTTPKPSQEIILTQEDIVISKPRITDLITKSYFTEAELGNVKPPTWLVKGYIPLGEVTVVYGPSDSGKSTFIMDWLCRICQHYPAMYVAGEDGSGVLVKRGAWMNHYKRGTNGNFNMRNDALDLFDKSAVRAFITEVFNLGLKVVVIDTLSQCSGAADENGSDMKQVMANLQEIAHTLNVAVIVAHHATKDGSNYRGYSGIKANSYGLISVQKINEVVYLEIERIKNTRPSPKRAFKFVSVETQYKDDDDAPISAPVLKPAKDVLPGDGLTPQEAELLSTIYEAQQGMERITLSDLKKGTRWADSVFYKVWKRLARESLIKKIGGKGIKQIGAVLEVTVDGEVLLRKSGALDEERYDDDTPSSDVLFEVNTKLLHGATQHVESTQRASASTAEQVQVTSELSQSTEQVYAPVEWTSSFDVSGYGASLPQPDAENDRSSALHSPTPQSFDSTQQATYSCYTLPLGSVAEQVPEVELGSESEDIDDDDRDFINRAFGNGGVRGGARDEQRSSVSSADSGLAVEPYASQAHSCTKQSTQSSASSSSSARTADAAMGATEQCDRSRDSAPPNDETVM